MAVNQQPLNIRNNNPGNLRFVGQAGATPGEGGFAKFETPQAGLDAMRAQIELDTQTRGLNLSQFLNKYAPPSENKTTNYIDFVAKKTGLDPNAPVPVSAIPQLQTAMIEMEGGPRSLSYFTQTAAKEPRTTVPVEKRPGVQVAAAFNPTDLPSSYTSALALNYLADTDPEGVTMSRVNEMLTELMEDGGGAAKPAGGKVLQQFAQAKSVDPFQFVLQPEEPKQTQQRVVPKMPKMMADGGLATRAMVANRPKLTRTDQDWLQARQKEFDAYNAQADEYQKAVDAYNAKVEAYNAAQGRGVENPGEFTMAAPVLPQTTAEQAEAYQTAAQDRAKRFYLARAAGIENVVNPEKYNLSGMSFSFADGGEVDYNQMAEQMTVGTLPEGQRPAGEVFQNIGRDVVRGAQYLPYDLIGAPVDIATMAMRPFGYKVEKPIGGSEWLIEKSRQAGIAQQPTGSAAETATRIGMGFVNPAVGARQVGRGIAALQKGAETVGTGAVRAITGKPEITTEQIYQAMAEPKGIMQLGAPAISRMPGGTFFQSEGSNLQRIINRSADQAATSAGEDLEKATAASEMFTKKAREFFEKRAGSINDELKQELLSGRIKMPGEKGEELFPKYLREAAKKGDVSAMRDIERRYDQMLGIKQINLPESDVTNAYAMQEQINQTVKENMLAQFKRSPELIPDDLLFKLTNKDPTDVRLRMKDNPEYFSIAIEPKLAKLINIDTEIVKPSDIVNYPGTFGRYSAESLSANELEAVKRKQPLYSMSTSYPELFGYDIEDLAKQAGKMSTQELNDMTFATFVSRASKLAVRQKTLEARADELQAAIKANKPVDQKALTYGTEVFQELPDGFTWRKIVDPDATYIQSAVLDNSIKGYANYGSYGPFNNGRRALEEGNVELFVLYDKNGMPVTNIEMVKGQKSGKFSMRQAQGNGPLTSNVMPENYLPQIKAFVNKTQPEDLPFNISKEIRYIDAPEGFAKGGMVDKPLYDRAA